MFEKINFERGKIVYNDFQINKDKPLEEHFDSLKEDLFQVNFDEKYLIDVGWFPSFSEDGRFQIVVIKDFEWENPILKKSCRTFHQLEDYMLECVVIVSSNLV